MLKIKDMKNEMERLNEVVTIIMTILMVCGWCFAIFMLIILMFKIYNLAVC
jgi:hypothetical protein